MKKLSSCLFYMVIIAIVLPSCKKPQYNFVNKYYQIKNGTDKNLFIKLYPGSGYKAIFMPDSYYLQPNESSTIFDELTADNSKKATKNTGIMRTSPIHPEDFYISELDSIDVYENSISGTLLKRYKRSESYQKSPYNKGSYDTVVKDKEGRDINVYTILNSDF